MSRANNTNSTFPKNLEIPFSSDRFFNHKKFNIAMQKAYGCTLSYCSVEIGSSLDKLALGESEDAVGDASSQYNSDGDVEPDLEKLVDLDFLDDLRIEDEPFFPTQIYVRNNMRKIFGLFLNDVGTVKPENRPTALIGSPGVGKSVLFFLAAMFRCSQKDVEDNDGEKIKKDVPNTSIYYRWARSDQRVSVFIMFRDEDQEDGEHKVHVLFTRSLNENNFGSLSDLDSFIRLHLRLEREHYFAFVDGPNYTETDKTLKGKYDYFCTSGGIPKFKNDLWGIARRWILNGWSKEEAMQALITLHVERRNHDLNNEMDDDELKSIVEKSNLAYRLCGGRIRDLCRAYDDFEGVKADLTDAFHGLDTADLNVASSETVSTRGPSLDRLRTMFRNTGGNDNTMIPLQYVDSSFGLMYIGNRVDVERWFAAYKLLYSAADRSIQGAYFEKLIHQWFDTIGTAIEDPNIVTAMDDPNIVTAIEDPPLVTAIEDPFKVKVCRSVGTKVESVKMLKERNLYWVPSVGNFDNIDSAIVIGDSLHVFQMTLKKQHGFNLISFIENFALPVWDNLPLNEKFKSVFIHIVIPSDNTFGFRGFEDKLTSQFTAMETDLHEENDKGYFDIGLEPLSLTVDMTTFRDVGNSLTNFLKVLHTVHSVGEKRAKISDRVKQWLLVQNEKKKAAQASSQVASKKTKAGTSKEGKAETSKKAKAVTSSEGKLVTSKEGKVVMSKKAKAVTSSEGKLVTSKEGKVVMSKKAKAGMSKKAKAVSSYEGKVVRSKEGKVVSSKKANTGTSKKRKVVTSKEGKVVTSKKAKVVTAKKS
jgi:hypothetical protein